MATAVPARVGVEAINYYEHHIGDYAAATAHLSWDEDMAYTRLLRAYYHHERGIPEGQGYRIARATTPAQRRAVDAVLAEFFVVVDGAYTQKRADAEIARFHDKQNKAKASANARWAQCDRNANASDERSANAMRTHSEGNATRARPQSPDTRHQTPEKKNTPRSARTVSADELVAEGIEPAAAEAWLQLRKAKHAPLSPFAWEAVKREASAAGMTPAQAVRMSAESGWQGFKAAWVRDRVTATETPYQRAARERVEQFAPGVAAKAPTQTVTAEVIDVTARRVG